MSFNCSYWVADQYDSSHRTLNRNNTSRSLCDGPTFLIISISEATEKDKKRKIELFSYKISIRQVDISNRQVRQCIIYLNFSSSR